MTHASRVAARFIQADDEKALDEIADHLVDLLLGGVAAQKPFRPQEVERVLHHEGLRAEDLQQLGEKTAGFGNLIRALGGMVVETVWHGVMQPFAMVNKLLTSPGFRNEIKASFRRALSHEARSTRHMLSVAGRLARGEDVPAAERRAAFHQMLDLLSKVVLAYFAGPHIAGIFSHGIWKALATLLSPADELFVVMLDKPLRAVTRKLLSADLGLLPSGFYTHFSR